MALTLRLNGSQAQNLVTASWWNDYYNLLTGAMTDQLVTLKTDLLMKATSAPPAAPTLNLAAGTSLGIGQYGYVVTFVDTNGGETLAGTLAQITTTSGNQVVSLSVIPTGPAGTASRNLYRTKVGVAGVYYKITGALPNNTATTYTDSTTDATLSATNPPTHPSFGGTILLEDASGNPHLALYNDGTINLNPTAINGETPGSLYIQAIVNGRPSGAADLAIVNTTQGDIFLQVGPTRLLQLFDGTENILLVGRNGASGTVSFQNGTTGSGFGFKDNANTKLAEMKGNGNFIIGGTTYQTSQSTYNTAASQTFDAFDVGECYETDQTYPVGTVVVLNPALGKMTKCTTDGDPIAHVIVNTPAFSIGNPDPANMIQPIALAGRVMANTAATITAGQLVCSDNNGGVRPLAVGEWNHVIGVSIGPNASGQVPLILRPMYAKG